jgi:hypothetical protein
MQRQTRIGGKANAYRRQGERAPAAKANAHRRQRRTRIGGKANAHRRQRRTRGGGGGGGGQGEDGAIAVYLSARSTSKSSAVKA